MRYMKRTISYAVNEVRAQMAIETFIWFLIASAVKGRNSTHYLENCFCSVSLGQRQQN